MARVKGGTKTRRRHKKILKLAKGNFGARSKVYKIAVHTVHRGLAHSFAGRKNKKRDYRSLWIERINIAVSKLGLTYSKFMNLVKKANIGLDRKMLAHIAVHDSDGFAKIVEAVKG